MPIRLDWRHQVNKTQLNTFSFTFRNFLVCLCHVLVKRQVIPDKQIVNLPIIALIIPEIGIEIHLADGRLGTSDRSILEKI